MSAQMNMQNFGPLTHIDHRRVSWPLGLENVQITLPESFIPLLFHNCLPTPDEAILVQSFHKSVDEELLQTQASRRLKAEEILVLQAQVSQLREKERALRKQSAACQVISSPFRHLPNDIIYQIIQSCPPTSHSSLVLSRVSKAWRSTIYGMSHMWTDIQLEYLQYSQPEREAHRVIKHVEFYSSLAGSLPLSVALDIRPSTAYETLTYIFDLLEESTGRTQLGKLQIACNDSTAFVDSILDYSGGPEQELTGVHSILLEQSYTHPHSNSHQDSSSQFCGMDLTQCLGCFPQLRHLWVEYNFDITTLHSIQDSSSTPWESLKTLCLHMPLTAVDWHVILDICPNLEWASFVLSTTPRVLPITEASDDYHDSLIGLKLQIEGPIATNFCDILTPFWGIELSSLQSLYLHVESTYINTTPQADVQASNLTNSLPSLSCLQICSNSSCALPCGIAEALPLLLATPTISVLQSSVRPNDIVGLSNNWDSHMASNEDHILPQLAQMNLELILKGNQGDQLVPKQTLAEAIIRLGELLAKDSDSTYEYRVRNCAPRRPSLKIRYHWDSTSNEDCSEYDDMHNFFKDLQEKCRQQSLPIDFEAVTGAQYGIYPDMQFQENFEARFVA